MSDVLQGPPGNYYDKFTSQNIITRYLMQQFKNDFLDLYRVTAARHVLEIGCGEGHMLAVMAAEDSPKLYGLDVDIPVLQKAATRCPQVPLAMADAHHLAYPSDHFELVVACEVLEHVQHPSQVLREAKRISCQYVIFSVPREPLWRVLNMLRGKYWSDWGNTPGHIQHWSNRGFVALVEQHFNVVEVRYPLPWTMILAEVNK